ncbi:MAG: hypothetical protein ACTHMZ_00375 [Actinomycetes bacterium]
MPTTPDFPVYGLDASWTGERWLEQWDWVTGSEGTPIDNLLWKVSLRHGPVEGGPGEDGPVDRRPTVVVTTVPKQPRIQISPRSWTAPAGLNDAAGSAFLGLISRRAPTGASRVAWLREQLDGWLRPGLPLQDEWVPTTVAVDGVQRPFLLLVRDSCWAAVGETGDVAVGLWGDQVELADLGLVPVDAGQLPRQD